MKPSRISRLSKFAIMEENNKILIYTDSEGLTKIDVILEDETLWLTQAQMCELYQTSKSNVSEHIKHIFEEGELQEDSVVRKFRTTADDGKTYNVTYYNLDMIISLGYRIKSVIATRFRQWATKRLKEYMIKGFTIDDERLKGNGGGNYWKELLDSVLSSGNRKLLTGAGSVSHKQALEKAKSEYRKYQEITLTPVEKAYLESIKEVSKEVKRR